MKLMRFELQRVLEESAPFTLIYADEAVPGSSNHTRREKRG